MGSCCSKEESEVIKTSKESLTISQPTTPIENVDVNIETSTEVSLIPEIDPPVHTPLTRIIYAPAAERHQCAYCDDPNGDFYDYFIVDSMLPCTLHEEFMENGWWRTGKVIFRPRFDVVCCPGYATRLPVEEYTLTKKHRRVIRKWGEFLKNGAPEWNQRNEMSPTCLDEVKTEPVDNTEEPIKTNSKPKPKKVVKPGLGPDPAKPPCKKSKLRKAERLKNKGAASKPKPDPQANPISLVDIIEQEITATTASFKHNLEVKLVPCDPVSLASTQQRAYDLYDKLQQRIHIGKTRFKSLDEFMWGFGDSCLSNIDVNQGSFHLQYFLDGELMMYSIVDITPCYFVSVYFVYEPDLRFLSPGIFTCLYEMSLVMRLKQTLPNLKYYGLGYYNHFNDKAVYKRQFKPQEVLCNETNIFVSLESAIPKFLTKEYCQLADSSVPVKEGRNACIDSVVVSAGALLFYRFGSLYSERFREKYRESLKQFVCEAGSKAAHQCKVDFLCNYTSS